MRRAANGGWIIHQSDIGNWGQCPARVGYALAGLPESTNSAAVYGSVMHHCLHFFERELWDLRQLHEDPKSPAFHKAFLELVQRTLEQFAHYWNPLNVEAICEAVPPDGWLPRQGYSELRAKGLDAIRKYADLIRFDDHELLAIEYGFVVPIEGTPHYLAGSVDRLAARYYSRRLVCAVDDWKTGKEYYRLRHNMQFTAYCYATTKLEFWTGFMGEDGFGEERGRKLYDRFAGEPRRATWINLRKFKFQDAGWRGPVDYERFKLAVSQILASVEEDIFPLTISGDSCKYCDFRSSCGVVGLPDEDYGRPGTFHGKTVAAR